MQASFAELLGRLPLEADLFVLLSMRDDFLFHCQSFEPLAPVFSELAPLGPPIGASLRRALVEPALRCGYRFEEESIVEEMLAEVEGERGALPMVAFTAERLWTKRDREAGLLTKAAYETMGGVGGALAQHAEATLTQIGEERSGTVRELFRRTSLELSYVKKDNADIMEDTCNGNLTNPEADAACDYFVLANLEGVRSNYEALILRFESRARDWFHVVGSYVYSDLQGNHDGGYETSDAFDVWPYFFVNRYGYLPDHSRHRVKVNGFVILPLDFSLALNSWWRSEFRWTPEIWPDAAPWGTMYLEPRGSRSEPGEYQIDFQVAKGFTWGRTRLQLIGTVYNLLSTETATEACTLETGCGTFEMGDPIAWQLPRRYELGVRLEF